MGLFHIKHAIINTDFGLSDNPRISAQAAQAFWGCAQAAQAKLWPNQAKSIQSTLLNQAKSGQVRLNEWPQNSDQIRPSQTKSVDYKILAKSGRR